MQREIRVSNNDCLLKNFNNVQKVVKNTLLEKSELVHEYYFAEMDKLLTDIFFEVNNGEDLIAHLEKQTRKDIKSIPRLRKAEYDNGANPSIA